MALSLGQPGTADSITADYLTQEQGAASILVHMHQDAVDGIARDAMEGFKALPTRGLEVGGLLLGHVDPGERPAVWIERYQRVECAHRFGPQFVLDDEDHRTLEQSAAAISQTAELSVVGFYRSHTRPGFQLEESDFDLVRRYFSDPSDLILLIRPGDPLGPSAQFFAHGEDGDMQSAGPVFPFRGRTVGSAPESDLEPVEPDTGRTFPPERGQRRIVPDFVPETPSPRERPRDKEAVSSVAATPGPSRFNNPAIKKWWPLVAAMLLVGSVVGFLLYPRSGKQDATPATVTGESTAPIRPLGLYVDPSGTSWRVSWNPAATALRDAAGVALFVRDGEDQNRIDLTPKDLQSGTYEYQPRGADVTFRLEVTGRDNHISAESFRFMRAASATAPAVSTQPAAPLADARPAPAPSAAPRLRATHRVAPVVPSGIRPRIRGTIAIEVRVRIDTRGRVTSAVPVTKPHAGLESYLADRAVVAATQWRFEPGPGGIETIHFAFEK